MVFPHFHCFLLFNVLCGQLLQCNIFQPPLWLEMYSKIYLPIHSLAAASFSISLVKKVLFYFSPSLIFPGYSTSSGVCRNRQDGISDFTSVLSMFQCLGAWIGYPNLTVKIWLIKSHIHIILCSVPNFFWLFTYACIIDKHQAKEGSLG